MRWTKRLLSAVVASALVATTWSGAMAAGASQDWSLGNLVSPAKSRPISGEYVQGEVIVKFKAGEAATAASLKQQLKLSSKRRFRTGAELVSFSRSESVEAKIDALVRSGKVEYAEPNYILRATGTPTDPQFGNLWGMNNTGQSIPLTGGGNQTGVADKDIDAPAAWDMTMGDPTVIVAVIDTGVDINHSDLAANIWTNPGEVAGDGLDNDGNGYIDDVHGWDFFNGDNTVFDSAEWGNDQHGTHVAGTIAARANNALGVVGVAPNVQIMPLKFIGPNGGSTADAISAIQYASANGAKVANNSWGGGGFSQSLADAIAASNLVFVAAAGNGDEFGVGYDIDSSPFYPASYTASNMLTVAAVDNQGNLGSFSNFGATAVDVAAPGVSILSTFPKRLSGGAGIQVDSTYKAALWGFGLEEMTNGADVIDLTQRLGSFFGLAAGSTVLIVDDDESDYYTGWDVKSYYEYAVTNAGYTGTTTSILSGANGPNLATLQGYDAVFWATGIAGTSTSPALTGTDISTLQAYLDGGGKLFLSGMNINEGITSTTFYSNYLHAQYVTEYGENKSVSGLAGTPFNGVAAYPYGVTGSYRDVIIPADGSAVQTLQYDADPDYSAAFAYLDGTSMATPHVSGIAALLISAHPELSVAQVISRIKSTVKTLPSLTGKVGTGGMADAYYALDYPPDAPTGLSAVPGNTQATISWNPNADPDLGGYVLHRLTGGTGDTVVANPLAGDTSYTDTGLVNGTTYTYYLMAKDARNQLSAASASVDVAPMAEGVALSSATYHGIGSEGGDRLKARITLSSLAANVDPGLAETVTATVTSTSDATGISVTLTESGVNTGLFQGKFGFAAGASDDAQDLLWVAGGDTVTVSAATFTTTATWASPDAQKFQIKSTDFGLASQAVSGVTIRLRDGTGAVLDSRTGSGTGSTSSFADNGDGTAAFSFTRAAAGTFSVDGYSAGYYMASAPIAVSTAATDYDQVETQISGPTYTDVYINLEPALALAADSAAPAVPTGTAATPSDRSANLSWAANGETDLAGYNVYLSTDNVNFAKDNGALVTGTTYTVTGLTNGTTYYLAVTAEDVAGNPSARSASVSVVPVDTVAPGAPTGLTPTAGNTTVDLTWSAPADPDVAGYNVYQSTDGTTYTKLNAILVAVANYTDASLANGTTYSYKVTAVDTSSNESTYSSVVQAMPHDGIAPDITGAAVSINSGAQYANSAAVTLTITLPATATEMQITESAAFTGATWEAAAASKSFTLSAGDGSKTVYVRFRDLDQDVSGAISDSITLDTTPPANGAVSINSGAATTTNAVVTLTITVPVGAAEMQVSEAADFTAAAWEATATSKSFTLTGGDGTRTVYVRFRDAALNQSTGVSDSITLDTTPPAAPTGVSAAPSDRAAVVTWNANAEPDLAGYNIYLSTDNVTFTKKNTALVTATTYTVTGLTNGATYYLAVESVDAVGHVSTTKTVVTVVPVDNVAPGAPTGLSATAGDTTISLTWTAPVASDLAGYNVYRSTDNATYTKINGTLLTVRNYSDTSLLNGTNYYYKVTAVDTSSNESVASSVVQAMPHDGIAPDTAGAAVSINSGDPYTNNAVVNLTITVPGTATEMQVSASSAFTGASWEAAAASKSFTFSAGDGTRTVYVRFRDMDHDVSAAISDTITLDTTPPASGSVSINGGAASTNNPAITLTITVPAGATQMQVSEAADFAGAAWEATGSSKSLTLSAGDGTRTIYVRFRDAALNQTAGVSDTIVLDTTPPSGGAVAINAGALYTKSTGVTLAITVPADATQMQISEDPTFTGATWVTKASNKAFTLSAGDGAKTVYVRFRDALLNEQAVGAAVSATITLDTAAPTGTISIDADAAVTTAADRVVQITLTPADTNPVSEVKVSENSAFTGAVYQAATSPLSFTLSTVDGTKTVYARFKDGAGNESTVVISDTIILNLAAPTVTGVTATANTALNIQFSEEMLASTINTTNITVTLNEDGSPVTGSVAYDAATRRAVFTPDTALAYGKQYDVAVTTGVQDLAGTAMAGAYAGSVTPSMPAFGGGGAPTEDFSIIIDNPTGDVTAEVSDSISGETDVIVEIPDAGSTAEQGTSLKAVEVPTSALDKLAAHGKDLIIDAGWAEMVIPAEVITDSSEYEGADKVSISIQLVDADAVAEGGAGMTSSSKVLEFTLTVGSNTVIFSNPVTVTIPYDSAANPMHLGVYRLNPATGIWEYRGGKVDTASQTVTFTTSGFSTYSVFEYDKQFTDLTGHWARQDVELMASRHIAKGTGTGNTFEPDASITRAQFAALLVRALGWSETAGASTFSDVDSSAWYAGAVNTAANQGVITGASGYFRPNDRVTRQEMAVMLQRAYAKLQSSSSTTGSTDALAAFADAADVAAWAAEAAALAADEEWIRGRDGNFAPGANATRAEAIVILYRFLASNGII